MQGKDLEQTEGFLCLDYVPQYQAQSDLKCLWTVQVKKKKKNYCSLNILIHSSDSQGLALSQ